MVTFFVFTSKIGEDELISTSIFINWVGLKPPTRGVTSHMQLFAMMTVLDFGDTVNGSELLHHLGCLKYKNPVNNGINYQPQPVRRISAINSSYSWITRNRCFLRFGAPPHSSIDRRWWRRAFSVWWWRWASHSDSLRKRTDICRVFDQRQFI